MTNGSNRNAFLVGFSMDAIESRSHSPTDSSEDSVEVKVEAIASRSKRKLTEPRRLHDASGPLKKRACVRAEDAAPFRPWSPAAPPEEAPPLSSPPSQHQYFRPPSPPPPPPPPRIPCHPCVDDTRAQMEAALHASHTAFPTLLKSEPDEEEDDEAPHGTDASASRKDQQRNYKNMTRERRIEANARERTRVHTISAAFDTLRHAVPAYSHSQKLSKLSVLRIACSYIMTLNHILDNSPEVTESVDNVSRTIQREGKLRKKKDE